jgi:hypothetical protein
VVADFPLLPTGIERSEAGVVCRGRDECSNGLTAESVSFWESFLATISVDKDILEVPSGSCLGALFLTPIELSTERDAR